mmetsp:Transcript_12818/g.22095  ORF Transcript_12818/g.22095 Transcript_12818/m.22095 type:complete len:208 (+) Transcript_12818:36-659(+)|eukprot:CAMPEP_0196657502 /NCGR_PEP_ID=MMETSP1086-20130531/23796_1 /TAXON_ID=77921 /ORGANISM="Cyanoptyche  gloeocystis , Strain SAG4.97" /LENGTH=207 /DNA_ID=CAMNT_0041990657 /DNA_START=34 /DNA_END=657 /DNA_ORIENTATION=+
MSDHSGPLPQRQPKRHNKIRPDADGVAASLQKEADEKFDVETSNSPRSPDTECCTQLEKLTLPVPSYNYEYLDHTADIQFHTWGPKVEDAFAGAVVAMFGYITELDKVDIDESLTREVQASAHDMMSLLFAFMDEFLFIFSTEYFVAKEVHVTSLDKDNWTITATGKGEIFSRSKHTPGTEVKAITYSNMQIHEKPERTDIYVIVDI